MTRSAPLNWLGTSARRVQRLVVPITENPMEIKFRHDVDNVLKEAAKQNKPVLLDFSAAPM